MYYTFFYLEWGKGCVLRYRYYTCGERRREGGELKIYTSHPNLKSTRLLTFQQQHQRYPIARKVGLNLAFSLEIAGPMDTLLLQPASLTVFIYSLAALS